MDPVPPFLHSILAEATRLSPTRRTSSDGTIGDQTHVAEGIASDHNPGVRGLVHAVDVSQSMPGAPYWDPRYGQFDAHHWGDLIAARIAAGAERRIKYLVSHNYVTGNAKVWSLEKPFWHDQDGDDHASHLHTSILSEISAEQSMAPYFVAAPGHSWPASTGDNDMPLPTDTVGALSTTYGSWRLTADGGVATERGPFYGSYLSLPADQRQGVRHFTSITERVDDPRAPGYTLWANDGAKYTFKAG